MKRRGKVRRERRNMTGKKEKGYEGGRKMGRKKVHTERGDSNPFYVQWFLPC